MSIEHIYDEYSERLIDAFVENRLLWDPEMAGYNDKAIKENTWENIAESLKLKPNVACLKFSKLIARFKKIKKTPLDGTPDEILKKLFIIDKHMKKKDDTTSNQSDSSDTPISVIKAKTLPVVENPKESYVLFQEDEKSSGFNNVKWFAHKICIEPITWNKLHPDFLHKEKRRNKWNEIGKDFNVSGEVAYKQFNRFRTRYWSAMKSKNNTNKEWINAPHFTFLSNENKYLTNTADSPVNSPKTPLTGKTVSIGSTTITSTTVSSVASPALSTPVTAAANDSTSFIITRSGLKRGVTFRQTKPVDPVDPLATTPTTPTVNTVSSQAAGVQKIFQEAIKIDANKLPETTLNGVSALKPKLVAIKPKPASESTPRSKVILKNTHLTPLVISSVRSMAADPLGNVAVTGEPPLKKPTPIKELSEVDRAVIDMCHTMTQYLTEPAPCPSLAISENDHKSELRYEFIGQYVKHTLQEMNPTAADEMVIRIVAMLSKES